MKPSIVGILGTATILGLIQLGCSPTIEEPSVESLTLAVRADVTGFLPNPPAVNEGYTLTINGNIFEGLVELDRLKRVVPALARSWENPDRNTYVIDLRPGLEFSDGSPVTSADFVASFNAAVNQSWPTRVYFRAFESVETEGDHRLIITTHSQYHTFLTQLHRGFVLPASAVEQHPVPTIGTGPYTLTHWEPGQYFALTSNPRYRGPMPAFEKVRFEIYPDDDQRIEAVLSGHAQVADHIPLNRIAELQKTPGVHVIVRQSSRVLFLGLRLDHEPFADPRVREAIDLGLDRKLLLDNAMAGFGTPASQVVASAVHGFNPTLPVTQPNQEKARKLLAEAGYPDGFTIELAGTHNRYVNDSQVLEEIARQLEGIGLSVTIKFMDKTDFFSYLDSGDANFFMLGWDSETGEAGNILGNLVHSDGGGFSGPSNIVALDDPELDALIDRAESSPTIEERMLRLQEAMAKLAADRPFVPLYVQPGAVLVSSSVHWEPQDDLGLRLREITSAN